MTHASIVVAVGVLRGALPSVSAAQADTLRLRAHAAQGTLVRYEALIERTRSAHVVQGPVVNGHLTYFSVAVVGERGDTLELRVTLDSSFLFEDQSRRPAGGSPSLGYAVILDDLREQVKADEAAAAITEPLFVGAFPLPERAVRRGESWSRQLDFQDPEVVKAQGQLQGKLRMKLREIRVIGADTTVVLELTLSAESRPFPAGQASIRRSVSLHGSETLSLSRGVPTDLLLEGSETDNTIVAGFHVANETHLRVTRRLLVAP